MSERVKHHAHFSINFRFRIMSVFIICAIIVILLFNYFLSMKTYEKSILEANYQIMDMTMKDVDDSLMKNSEFLLEVYNRFPGRHLCICQCLKTGRNSLRGSCVL